MSKVGDQGGAREGPRIYYRCSVGNLTGKFGWRIGAWGLELPQRPSRQERLAALIGCLSWALLPRKWEQVVDYEGEARSSSSVVSLKGTGVSTETATLQPGLSHFPRRIRGGALAPR